MGHGNLSEHSFKPNAQESNTSSLPSIVLTIALSGTGFDLGSIKKPPFGPLIDEIIPSRTNVCNIFPVKASGASTSLAISGMPSLDPLILLIEMYNTARRAYSHALENIVQQNIELTNYKKLND